MTEGERLFKAYLRSLMRTLKAQKEALQNKDYDKAERILDILIEDTQKGIAD